jgi:hypothetical protein
MPKKNGRKRKEQFNTRLSAEARQIVAAAQERFGLTQAAVLEMALRELRRQFALQIQKGDSRPPG